MRGMSSLIIWKGTDVSNSWHTQSVMWLMASFCSKAEKKAEGWESKTSTIIILLKNYILTVPVYIVRSTVVVNINCRQIG